jgi:hypothetical protein
MRALSVLLWSILLSIIGQQNLLACSCAQIQPVCEAVWRADAVFLGTVVAIEPPSVFGIPLAWPFPTERQVTFVIKEQFNGQTQKKIEIRTATGCCACGIDFQRGRDYLVYAHRNAETRTLQTSICTRTATVDKAADDLAYLRTLTSSTPPHARVYGFITTNEWDLRRAHSVPFPRGVAPKCSRSASARVRRRCTRRRWIWHLYDFSCRSRRLRIHINSAQRLQGFEFRLPPRLKKRTITGFVHWPNGKPAMAFVELKDNAFAEPERSWRSGMLCAEAGQGTATPCPAPPCSRAAADLRFAPDGWISLDEAEHATAQSKCQRRYAPMVFGIIPECRSASLRN